MKPSAQNGNSPQKIDLKLVKTLPLPEAKKELGYSAPFVYDPKIRSVRKRVVGGRAAAIYELTHYKSVEAKREVAPVCAAGHCRLYSAIADLDTYSRLWMYLRSLDTKGRGWVETTVTKCSEDLGLSRPTIKRYIRTGLNGHSIKHGEKVLWVQYFRYVVKDGDTVRISYISLNKVCMQLELEDYGAIAEVPHFQLKASKELATHLTVEARQRASRYEAKRESKVKLVDPNYLTQFSHPCESSKRRIPPGKRLAGRGQLAEVIYIGRKKTFVTQDFVLFGTSQQGTGEQMGRHQSTINRRLSNSRRLRKGLDRLERRQLAVRSSKAEYDENRMDDKVDDKPFMRLGDKYFRLATNIYEDYNFLIHARVSRKWFRQKLDLIKWKLQTDPAIKNPVPKLEKVADSNFENAVAIDHTGTIVQNHSHSLDRSLQDKDARSSRSKKSGSSSSGLTTRSYFQSQKEVEARSFRKPDLEWEEI